MMICLLAIAVTVGVFTGLSAVLLVAQRYLVTFGTCVITVNEGDEGKNVFEVPGGSTLLSLLQDNEVFISSACGGKGTCGYCRVSVPSGGGQVLPTERPYLTRTEIRSNVRLACQVKVRNDIDIFIPDFLSTVRTMVENETYDPNLRWRFITSPELVGIPQEKIGTRLTREDEMQAVGIIEKYRNVAGSIVPVLQGVNSAFNYLPEPSLAFISKQLNIALSDVYRVATFYNAFSLKPKGKNTIRVCLGTSCYVKGGKRVLQAVKNKLGIRVGETTEDKKFSLETVSCIGCCGQSPVLSVNDEIYGYFRPDMLDDVLQRFD